MGKEFEIVELLDSNDKKVEFAVIMTFQVNENDYAALLPVEDEEQEVYLFRVKNKGEETTFESIDDKEEFDIVAESYNEFA